METLEITTKNMKDWEEEVQHQRLALVELLKSSQDPKKEASTFLRILKYRTTKQRAVAQVKPFTYLASMP